MKEKILIFILCFLIYFFTVWLVMSVFKDTFLPGSTIVQGLVFSFAILIAFRVKKSFSGKH